MLVITNGLDSTEELFSGMVTVNQEIIVTRQGEDTCFPDSIVATVMDTSSTTVLQSTTMDTDCKGRGLFLLTSYGALEFQGYSCDENDVHNCFVEVLYNVTTCNIGDIDMTLNELEFDINGTITDFIANLTQDERVLVPTECIERFQELLVERCADRDYCASARVNASSEVSGPICEDMDELKFDFLQASVQPSPAPSTSPSLMPTIDGSPAPSPAPSNACLIDISLDCTPEEGFGETCEGIPIFTTICTERPFQMKFRYNGGDCAQSFNIQPSSLFACFDFNEKPPTAKNVTSYITAFVLGGGDVYFEGFVNTGDIYTLNAPPNERVSANMNITIYDPRGQTNPALIKIPANILQTVRYHSSCSRNLFLKDRFGNNQLVEWTSREVGLVTCFINATLNVNLLNPATTSDFDVRLLELNSLTNFDPFIFNKTDEVFGVELLRGESFTPSSIDVTLDLTVRRLYNFFTTVVGETLDGVVECNGDDFYEFIAGNPLPPTFPTIAPSVSPTFTPFPTPDPLMTGCGLVAKVTCVVTDGPTSDCTDLTAPLVRTCNTAAANVPLTELRFQHTAKNCEIGSDVECQDENGGPSGVTEVFVEIFDDDGTYVEAVFQLEDIITVRNPTGFTTGEIEIVIYTVDRDQDDNIGDQIQTLVINTECADTTSLVLGRDYGTLMLTAFDNEEVGLPTRLRMIPSLMQSLRRFSSAVSSVVPLPHSFRQAKYPLDVLVPTWYFEKVR
jgi:hypothetical protein